MTDAFEIRVDAHPALVPGAFASLFAGTLAELDAPELARLLREGAAGDAVPPRDEAVRKEVRDLLRHGGYKPTGRGKPSSEYLVKAFEEGRLAPINVAVDAGNLVSLVSGFPVSVVDLDCVQPPLRIGIAEAGTRYVFNLAGQTIDVSGLLCLFDEQGPCANAVKDAQRTKTGGATRRTLSVVWGCEPFRARVEALVAGYRELVEGAGATTADLVLASS